MLLLPEPCAQVTPSSPGLGAAETQGTACDPGHRAFFHQCPMVTRRTSGSRKDGRGALRHQSPVGQPQPGARVSRAYHSGDTEPAQARGPRHRRGHVGASTLQTKCQNGQPISQTQSQRHRTQHRCVTQAHSIHTVHTETHTHTCTRTKKLDRHVHMRLHTHVYTNAESCA